MQATVARSYLYVPGDRPEMLAKALTRGADALIVDLEDAVAPAAKAAARVTVADWLDGLPAERGTEVWVRTNPGALGRADAAALVSPRLAGLVVAKTESPEDLVALDRVLSVAESDRGLSVGALPVVPLLESASAVLRADRIAAGPRVRRLQLGEADLRADIGVTPSDDERELLYLRSHIVLVSAALRLDPPVAPTSVLVRDDGGLRLSTLALARMGFVGRACIHPAQVAVVNDVFTPTSDEVERARALVAAFDRAVAAGDGVMLDASGRMVDEAVVRQSRNILSRVRR
ncbi:CoA ester lyase [Rhodococcus antarcticus]|jgi:citrate lyase subunit beta/citryl-CoA lyase|uniref:CoA ester lyase n=1 Tax=Rhodococcus antarcticus TaxID=2987751 RepID=A0ABY6NWH9_9NOCA|nr:CoA ester lyase [Rhodococcus antarcticus]UZJ23381.1 CoA ester lyase [Rhodococcus antarcticus]